MSILIRLIRQDPCVFSPRPILKHIIQAVSLFNETIPHHDSLAAQIEPGIPGLLPCILQRLIILI